MPGFIQAKADAPPTGFEVFDRVAADLGPLWSSELFRFASHRIGVDSFPPCWLFRRDSPDVRVGASSYDGPVRADDDDRFGIVAVAELLDLDCFNTFMFRPLAPRVGR